MKKVLSFSALLLLALAGALTSSVTASAHLDPCHFTKTCPSDNHSYTWQGKICTSHSFERTAADTITLTYDGHTYWCHAESAPPPTTTTAPPVTTTPTPPPPPAGALGMRTKTSGCQYRANGAENDLACTPGQIDPSLTKEVLCSSNFHTGTVRNVPQSEKYDIEREYGLAPKSYGRTLEIDHLISLELGGSNDIANLFPETGAGAANYHKKDGLENKLHAMVCAGTISLHDAQVGIATDWIALYTRVYGNPPR